MRGYLDELHRLCPAARAYTYDMLWEDFRISAAIGSMCMAIALGPVRRRQIASFPERGANARARWGQVLIDLLTPEPPFHPNVVLFSKFFPRCRATYTQLDIAGIVIDTAARLGLED